MEDTEAKLREMTNRMKAWRNAFFVAFGLIVVLCIELAVDFV